jgi:hypothetical protein
MTNILPVTQGGIDEHTHHRLSRARTEHSLMERSRLCGYAPLP